MVHMSSLFNPKRFLLIYFALIVVALIWLIVNLDSFCPQCTEGRCSEKLLQTIERQKRDLEERESIFVAQIDSLLERERKIEKLEANLQRLYPQADLAQLRSKNSENLPVIYAVTPTYARYLQKAELTRLANTFRNVANFHWILVEDAETPSSLVSHLLLRSGITHTILTAQTPEDYKLGQDDPNWKKPRGVLQRNRALEWIRNNVSLHKKPGVLYFADDDNTYDTEIFEEMRDTKKVSVWPVGLVGKMLYESPIVVNGKVTGYHTSWKADRPFPMDMAGFALNIQLLFDYPTAKFSLNSLMGSQEGDFLSQLVTNADLEPKANNCTKILVWHTRTEKPRMKGELQMEAIGQGSDHNIEV